MAARNFWCLTSDAGKQCGHLYFYAPVFSVTEKPPKFSKTQSGRRSAVVLIIAPHGSSSAPFSPTHKCPCTEMGIGWLQPCRVTHVLNCTRLKSSWIQHPHWNLHKDKGHSWLVCSNLFAMENISVLSLNALFILSRKQALLNRRPGLVFYI